MKIYLSPVRTDVQLEASVSGDTITVNGAMLDFTPLLEGETLPQTAILNDWIIGDVHRITGEVTLVLCLPHGANAPFETRFPGACTIPITVVSGDVPLPPYDALEILEA